MIEQKNVLEVKDMGVYFSDNSGEVNALEGVNFNIAPHEFVCVLGPSGSGKSVLMRVLAGLVAPTQGCFHFPAKNNNGRKIKIGLVFQQSNLMPWRSVLQNVTLPLEMERIPLHEAEQQARDWIELVGLNGFESSYPDDLSGGMAQRAALARALVQDPDLLLLDEPFGALDALTREYMNDELLRIWQERKKTVLMVTHSISESLMLSDRILIFSPRPGRVTRTFVNKMPRPRKPELRYSAEFVSQTQEIRSAIRIDLNTPAANPA